MLKRLLELIPLDQEKLYQEAKKQVKREEILRHVITAIRNSLDINDTLNYICREISGLFEVPMVIITEFPDKNNYLNSSIRINYGAPKANYSLLNKEGINQWGYLILNRGNNIVIEDISQSDIHKSLKENSEIIGTKSFVAVPIKKDEGLWGSICIAESKTRVWTEEEVRLLEQLADHIYIAINQAELYETTKKQAHREKLTRNIIQAMRKTLDMDELKYIIVNEIGKAFNADRCFVRMFDQDKDDFLVLDKNSEYLRDSSIKSIVGLEPDNMIHNLIKKLLKENKANIIRDFDEFLKSKCHDDESVKYFLDKYQIKSDYGFPILYDKKPIGVVVIHYTKNIVLIDEEEINLLHLLSNHIGIVLKQAELYHKTKKQTKREVLIRRITETTRNILDMDKIKWELVSQIGEAFGADKCFMRFYDKEKDAFGPVDNYSYYVTRPELKQEYEFWKELDPFLISNYKKGEAIFIQDMRELIDQPYPVNRMAKSLIENYGIYSNYCFPIFYEEEFVGMFAIQYTRPKKLSKEDIKLVQTIAFQTAIALHQAMLYYQAKKQVEREKLLRNISDAIKSSIEIDELKQNIVNEVGKTFNSDRCFIRLYIPDKTPFSVSTEYLASPLTNSIKGFTFGVDFIKYVQSYYSQNKLISVYDANKTLKDSQVAPAFKQFIKDLDIKSSYGFPIYFKNEFLGSIVVQYAKNLFYMDKDTIELLKIIAIQAGQAIKQAEQHEKIKKQVEREELLRKIISTVRNTLEINEIEHGFVNEVGKAFNSDRCFFRVYDRNQDRFLPVRTEYRSSSDIPSIIGATFPECRYGGFKKRYKQGEIHIFPDLEEMLKDSNSDKIGIKALIDDYNVKSNYGISIYYEDKFLGVFVLHYTKIATTLDDNSIELLKSIADQSGIALNQADLYTKAQQASKVKSEFLANMSHEFRTPLNAIIGFTDIIRNGNYGRLPDKVLQYLNNVSKSSKHLLNLVNDVLDISKVEADKIELIYEDICSKALIYEVIAGIESLATRKNIKIDLQLQDIEIKADSKRFVQIIYNLISNAVKFTLNGGKVTIKTALSGNNFVTIVEDTGIGIAKANYSKIFKHFSQIDSSASRHYEGTGLGLVLTKKLVELHGGIIYFESEVNKGSKFVFELPITPDISSKYTVLVVEDNVINMDLTREVLEQAGFRILEAKDASIGIPMAIEFQPNLILMDMHLPGKNGYEASREIKAHPKTQHIPVIAFTAMVMEEDKKKAYEYGCDAIISKPININTFASTVESYIHKSLLKEPVLIKQ